MTENTVPISSYAGAGRRLMAIIYDLILLIAVLFIATAIAMIFNQGTAFKPGQALYPYYVAYLLIISFIFYGWFWTHGGQTLGMKTWKMKLQQINGHAVTWPLALVRFITSAAGLGLSWSLLDPQRRGWHDIASNCVVIDLRPGR